MSACPCGTGRELDECCGPVIRGASAATPEVLMRSRYTAYTQGDIDYLGSTLAPEIRDDFNRAEAARIAAELEWLGLDVVSSAEDGDSGTVEFYIRFRRDGQELGQHELAEFRRENGCWFYTGGKVGPKPPPRRVEKIGRNDPCPCGSGKKYKKCCGA